MFRFCISIALALALAPVTVSAALAAVHPLDPLSAQEIRRARTVISQTASLSGIDFFPSINLLEPAKSEVMAYTGGAFTRKALVYGYDFHSRTLYHITVDVTARQVVEVKTFVGEQPPVSYSEFGEVDAITHASVEWQNRMVAQGVNPAEVYVDVWAGGDMPPNNDPNHLHAGHRILRGLAFLRGPAGAPNPYVRPIEGVVTAVCMDHHVLAALEVSDEVRHGSIYPVNQETGEAALVRAQLPPLITTGQGYTLNGNLLTWDKWRLRIGFTFREGLVLHQVEYRDDADPTRYRPIMYRGALSEIYVPYARDHLNWSWRTAFDVGEYHLGQYANPLELDVDVPNNAVLLDATVADDTLAPYRLPAAIGIYEQHDGLLWARTDPTSYKKTSRGHRKLHITWHAWIGNYIYGYTWILGRDGSIEMKVALTGTLLMQGVQNEAEAEASGALVAPGVGAPSHQHFFNFRMDMDVDGVRNTAVETDTQSRLGPFLNGFEKVETKITSEGFRDHAFERKRGWAIESATRENRIHHPTGYTLLPGEHSPMFSSPGFGSAERAAFAKHPFWVTRFDENELYSAGLHPYAGREGAGLPEYTTPAQSAQDADIVIWHSLGFTHHPHPDEYPVMNAEHIGFKLIPHGFFDRNPALDLPPTR